MPGERGQGLTVPVCGPVGLLLECSLLFNLLLCLFVCMQHFSKCRITNCCRRRSNTTIWSVFETNTGQTKYLCPGNCLTIQNNVRTFLSWIPVTHNQLATMPFTYREFGLYFIMHKHIESIQKHPNKLQITQFSQFSR